MNTRILYIEKKREFDRNVLATALTGIQQTKMSDVKYTISGEDIQFLAVETTTELERIKNICADLGRQGFKAMYSGVIHATAIAGVVRHGNCLGYKNENDLGMFMQTDIIDNRCMISFPLVENRHVDKKIKFLPLDITLPTEIGTVERRIKSMRVMRKGEISEIDYVEEMTSLLSIATLIYPHSLIWRRAEVPQPIERLMSALTRVHEVPLNKTPAYLIMTENEREYLQLYLYVSEFNDDTGEHLIPMNAVIPPSLLMPGMNNPGGLSLDQFVMGQSGIDRLMNVTSYEDIENLSEFMRNMARGFFGNAPGTRVKVSNRDGNLNIQFEKRNDGRNSRQPQDSE